MAGHPLRSSDVPAGGRGVDSPAVGDPVPSIGQREPLAAPASSGLSAAPISAWLTLQLGALALAAFRVPLAAQYPPPGEFQAVRVMLAAQFAGIALLFPWLLRGRSNVLTISASAWLMLMAAAALAAWSLAAIAPLAAFLTFWIIVLATLRQAIPCHSMIVSAAASAYILGGPLLAYLHQDFANSTVTYPELAFGPLFTAISTPHHLPPLAWAEPAAIELIAVLLLVLRAKLRNSAPLSATEAS